MDHKCFCTECGWRGASKALAFDISPTVIRLSTSALDTMYSIANKDEIKSRIENIEDKYPISIEDIEYSLARMSNGNITLPYEFVTRILKQMSALIKKFIVDKAVSSKFSSILKSFLDKPLECVLTCHPDNTSVVTHARIGKEYYQLRHCPHCSGLLSSFAGVYPEISVSVLGGQRASKSTTLVATLNKIPTLGSEFSVQFEPVVAIRNQWVDTQQLMERYRNNIAFAATSDQDGKKDNFVKGSFLVSVAGKKTLLSFIDIPGEFITKTISYEDPETVQRFRNTYEPIYQNLDFLWICVDEAVLTHEKFVHDISGDKEFLSKYGYTAGKRTIEPTSIENIYTALASLSNIGNIKGAALIWGKIDQLENVKANSSNPPPFDNMGGYSENCNTLYVSGGIVALKAENIRKLSSHVRSQIIERRNANGDLVWQHEDTVRQLNQLFSKRICYFATSNYGHSPKEEKVEMGEKTISPINTELPLLWTLTMAGTMRVYTEKKRMIGTTSIRTRFLSNPDDEKVSDDAVKELCRSQR